MLQETITTRRKFLVGLVSQLKTLKKATLPVQQQLGILHTKRSKQNYLAELLPLPLYILYTQLQSHKEAFGEAIELDIVGSGKDALTLAKHLAMKEAGNASYMLTCVEFQGIPMFIWLESLMSSLWLRNVLIHAGGLKNPHVSSRI